MAQLFPDFENIARLKVKPTTGELHLLHILATNLNDDFEIYYQPMLNGDMPDIILMKKGHGAIVIEVKDWNLGAYHIDENNNWHESRAGHKIRSPFQQVFVYKKNLFDLHINGLAEKNVINKNFYSTVKVFIYFHNSFKRDVDGIFSLPEQSIREKKSLLNSDFQNKKIDISTYNKKMDYLEIKNNKINRDKNISIHEENINRLLKVFKEQSSLFDNDIYEEFKRYLNPPFHVENQGKELKYDSAQEKLIGSSPGFQKVKGVAGSGKTTILAKRAVNAHKRHEDKVLILTYNKTLRNYIRDKISDVRDSFSWGSFVISTYHSFITQAANQHGLDFDPPENAKLARQYMEKFYANEKIFDGYQSDIYKYKTILIDEIQDYEPEWIKIIRKYFLEDEGEMVIFGDDSQNIYSRNITKRDSVLVQGFGQWNRLKKSHRAKDDSLITRLGRNFQDTYLLKKYDTDSADIGQQQGALSLEILEGYQLDYQEDTENSQQIFESIMKFILKEKIHPNDICVISANIAVLRKVDKLIRDLRNEKTQTTFETEEQYNKITTQKNLKEDEVIKNLETIRGSKKFSFELNSGLIKLATIHSFKGMECSTVIYIPGRGENDEIIYTSITRARKNLLVLFPKNTPSIDFFSKQIPITSLELRA